MNLISIGTNQTGYRIKIKISTQALPTVKVKWWQEFFKIRELDKNIIEVKKVYKKPDQHLLLRVTELFLKVNFSFPLDM